MSVIEQAPQQQERRTESRQPDLVVRAKTGPGHKEWSTVGSAWNRENGKGISVKLHSVPIGPHWNGVLKLLPPYADEDAADAFGE